MCLKIIFFFVLGVFCSVGYSTPPNDSKPVEEEKSCRSFIGNFKIPCPAGMHCYYSPCGSAPTISKRTCDSPVAREMGFICDMVRCDCDEPKVFNEATKTCVSLEKCPPPKPNSGPDFEFVPVIEERPSPTK